MHWGTLQDSPVPPTDNPIKLGTWKVEEMARGIFQAIFIILSNKSYQN